MFEETKQTEETQEQVCEKLKGRDKYPYSDISDIYGYSIEKSDLNFFNLCLDSKSQNKKTF